VCVCDHETLRFIPVANGRSRWSTCPPGRRGPVSSRHRCICAAPQMCTRCWGCSQRGRQGFPELLNKQYDDCVVIRWLYCRTNKVMGSPGASHVFLIRSVQANIDNWYALCRREAGTGTERRRLRSTSIASRFDCTQC
jgi:hypothetical protein